MFKSNSSNLFIFKNNELHKFITITLHPKVMIWMARDSSCGNRVRRKQKQGECLCQKMIYEPERKNEEREIVWFFHIQRHSKRL